MTSMKESDELLVTLALAGDQDAYTELYRRMLPQLKWVAWKMLRRRLPEEQEDFVQEAAARVFIKLDSFRGESTFRTWSEKVAVKMALMYLRHAKDMSKYFVLDSEAYVDSEVGSVEERGYAAVEARILVEKLICHLDTSPARRQIVEAHFLGGLEFKEIAMLRNTSVGNAKSACSRGIADLRVISADGF